MLSPTTCLKINTHPIPLIRKPDPADGPWNVLYQYQSSLITSSLWYVDVKDNRGPLVNQHN